MDEAEKYQQRLQAIAERRRQQEEEERLARETEEERLKTAQQKRKHLREQWLSEAPPVPDEPATGDRSKSQKTPEGEDEEAADARSEERASQEEHKESGDRTAAVATNGQAGTDEDEQEVNKEAEDLSSKEMAQRTFHESGQEGRSVLGMLAVQVERDPKTGATVVRSVAPVSAPAGGAPTQTAVFDDGRKSIHAVGGSGGQLSTEELGQILSAVDGVGMTVLLDDLQAEAASGDAGRAPEGVVASSARPAVAKGDAAQFDGSRGDDLEAEPGTEGRFTYMGHGGDKKRDGSTPAVGGVAGQVGDVGDLRLEEGPVTLVFLGYTDTENQGEDQEDDGGMQTAEHVMITEDGEEHASEPESSASPPEGEAFQDVPLDGSAAGAEARAEGANSGRQNSPDEATSKAKTCKCCSVM